MRVELSLVSLSDISYLAILSPLHPIMISQKKKMIGDHSKYIKREFLANKFPYEASQCAGKQQACALYLGEDPLEESRIDWRLEPLIQLTHPHVLRKVLQPVCK